MQEEAIEIVATQTKSAQRGLDYTAVCSAMRYIVDPPKSPMEPKAKHPLASPMEQKAKHPLVSPMEQKAKHPLVSPF